MSSQAQVGVEFPLAGEPFEVPARFALPESASGEFIGNPHLERQAALQFDLAEKKVDCLRSRQAQMAENVLDLALEAGFDPRSYHCGFAHKANVALLWLHG